MADFSLIKTLQGNPTPPTQSLLPEGIVYEEYEVDSYDCGTITVHVPRSEAELFEQALSEYTVIVRSDVRSLMRTHRGIIGK